MKALLTLLLVAGTIPKDHPRTYLASVVELPLRKGESVESFSFSTWGVKFMAICRIPGGWRIKAGSSATPDGELAGEGSQGATWFNQRNPAELRNLVLLRLYGPVQRKALRDSRGNETLPATFKGSAVISTEAGERKVSLTYKNILLTPARRCSP
jgi:hypothetical protein